MHMQAFSSPNPSLYAIVRSWLQCRSLLRGTKTRATIFWEIFFSFFFSCNPSHGICPCSAGVPCLRSGLWDCPCGYPVNFRTKCEAYGEGLKIYFRFFSIVSLHIEKVFQFSILVLQSFLRMGASWRMQRSQLAGLRICNVLENLYLYF